MDVLKLLVNSSHQLFKVESDPYDVGLSFESVNEILVKAM